MKSRFFSGLMALAPLFLLWGCASAPTPVPPLAPTAVPNIPVAAVPSSPTSPPAPKAPPGPPTLSDLDAARTRVFAEEIAKEEAAATRAAKTAAAEAFSANAAKTAAAAAAQASATNAAQTAVAAAATAAARVVPPAPTGNYYRLVNRHTQMCLTAQRNTWAIVQEPCGNNRPEQMWKWDGLRIALESQSGICVGYNWGFGDDNNALRQVGCSAVRPWTIYLVQWLGDPPPLKVAQHPHALTLPLSPALERGPYYYIAMSDGDCVDVERWSHDVGQRIIHTPCQCPLQRDYDNQLWSPY